MASSKDHSLDSIPKEIHTIHHDDSRQSGGLLGSFGPYNSRGMEENELNNEVGTKGGGSSAPLESNNNN